ncbi:MAG: aspartate--tRNA ligase [Candidatus Nomurabacteria bacterium]|nr:aspartate--tRNA ligase [Candidatus Nomurabacteria bacterium]USN87909.1 MAG: aspartate--tRNA ligase [Candidatus Nomurabacteria bacterium]
MERILIGSLSEHIDKEVTIKGWVDVARLQGKMAFFDFRDRSGKVQGVVFGKPEVLEIAKELKSEYVVAVTGKVNKRPEKMVKEGVQNGDIELEITGIDVLAESDTPPFDLGEDSINKDEEVRLKYRYLDLRTERMQKNIRIRSEFVRRCRNFLMDQDFVEIETPILTESTPEGSRDFVVPSRHNPGQFYALPQSPQQYKQMLMTAGFERYVQIARAIRDEDLRADRGYEHTQIDVEMSFVERNDVMRTIEDMITSVVESMGYTIKHKPFPVVTYADSIEKYGDDKFDLRTEEDKKNGVLAYAWVVDFPFFEKTDKGTWTFSHNPFSMPKAEHLEWLLKGENIDKILTTQYDLVCNGYEAGGGSIRAHKPEILEAVYKIMGNSEEEMQDKVGHMLEAFKYGTPPHGGIALGVERNVMNLTGEEALREVQAFPMTRKGQTAVMNGPKSLEIEQLLELGISVDKKK